MQYGVFAVDNADRITLMTPSKTGAPTLKSVELSFIQAPHQGRRTANGDFTLDEPYGFEAVDLIRNKFIGKTVTFHEDYTIDALKRTAGRISLMDEDVDASCLLLEEGLAGISTKLPQGMKPSIHKQYVELMRKAFKNGKGIFASEKEQAKHVRQMINIPQDQLPAVIKPLEGKEIRVRVERVLSGCAVVVTGKEIGNHCAQVAVNMTGITMKGLGEEYPPAAKLFTEKFLLHRAVTLRVDGIDSYGNVLGSVISAKGIFQEELLRQGLAKILPPTVTLSPHVQKMMEAEEAAKANRQGHWKNYMPPENAVEAGLQTVSAGQSSASPSAPQSTAIPTFASDGKPGPAYQGPKSFSGRLVQVIHADTLVVRDEETNKCVRVALAGVRCNKSITRDQDGNSPETRVTYSELSWEAREFVRSRYIGWHVAVDVEFARVIPETKELRPAAIVRNAETGVNIATALLEEGLVTFFLGRNAVCRCAAEYQAAELTAKEARKGLHSEKDFPLPTKVLELSHLGESRSRYYLSFLQRGMQGNRPPVLRGVVDVVISGNSLRFYIPKEHFQIPVRLAGVIAPAPANQSNKADPFSEESKNFAVDLVQQREANLQVFSSDRAGNFIGSVTLDNGTNVSVAMVKAGLATVGNADRLPFLNQLLEAEEAAKKEQRFVWSSGENLPQRAAKLETKKAIKGGMFMPVPPSEAVFNPYIRTEVAEDGLSVYLLPHDEKTQETKETIKELLATLIQSTNSAPCKPSAGQIVAVQYAADQEWYRAKITRVIPSSSSTEGTAHAMFIDFGNAQSTPFNQIRSIPRIGDYAYLLDTPGLAIHARLAFLKSRIPPEAAEMAYDITHEYTESELLVKPEYRDASGSTYYTVTWSEKDPSLSEELLQRGAAFLCKKASKDHPAYERHAAAGRIARQSHLGIWEYGDADDDDE